MNCSEMAANNGRNEYEALASSIQGRLQQQSPFRAQHSIFRVPNALRNGNDKVYVPKLLSIGPLNRGLNLQTLERIKSWYLHCLLERCPTPNTGLHHFVKAIKDIEQDCRDCYEEQIDLSSDEFVEIMVVDGCFIIELFRKFSRLVPIADGDPLFRSSWKWRTLINDLLLLENQLPWIVLTCLFELTRETVSGKSSLSELTLNYFKEYMLAMDPRANTEAKHLLDFTRNSLLGSFAQEGFEDLRWSPIPSVSEMSEAGIIFETGKKDDMFNITFQDRVMEIPPIIPSVSEMSEAGIIFETEKKDDMLNITFKDGVMKIPPIRVYENGESLFRNMIAYEQCVPSAASKMTSYAILLQHLIRSEKDLELLTKREIINNSFCKDISWFLNPSLSNNMRINDFSYAELFRDLNDDLHKPWRVWQTRLKNIYFKDPWTVFNLLIPIGLVVFLTIIQTVYAVLSYNKPS